ncbi:class I SAM-dependent methyltransferase [Paraglaciecola aquimarina]|uniref:Class I SAM-dependent methyltransferase n=1 Tax=Paraglaciecola algarum TaxID=3050085 RepID=A0ABS9D8I3_9ALTE|nr:class I SAM-dependent methyltransferase [Paraglaciecola sp. G1-23]MCF2948114.1 class I SAM-dependent methyltransferase [Paraglaciecola sp. G1-23]
MTTNKKSGDFTGLADNYSKFRPAYSQSVLDCIISLLPAPMAEVDFVDVGAGTGIWTRMVSEMLPNSTIAIEPNDDMRKFGKMDSEKLPIQWMAGSGEAIDLSDNSADLLTMASSFHWVDFEKGTKEFSRILRPNGRFVALWNPRHIERNPILVEIEQKLYELVPELKRVSSGRSGLTENLTDMLTSSPYFDDVVFLSAEHSVKQSTEEYLGVWWSVNDIRAQAGEQRFSEFMSFVEQRISGMDYLDVTYTTRAWVAKRI